MRRQPRQAFAPRHLVPDETFRSWRCRARAGVRPLFPALARSGIGDTVASFANGSPFTLEPEQRESGWRGGLRLLGGSSVVNFGGEVNAEQQQGRVSIGARAAVTIVM